MSRLMTWISPIEGRDEPKSLPLSGIKRAYYQKGILNGKLTVRLNDDSSREFFFRRMHFGQLAQEIAQLINANKERPG